jgi:hypothetical protein
MLCAAWSSARAGHNALVDTSRSPSAKMYMPDLGDVKWAGGLWGERFEVCRDTMIPHLWTIFSDQKESHAWANFLMAAGLSQGRDGKPHGPSFNDGDFLKWVEALAQMYAVTRDPKIDAQLDQIIAVIAKAQRADGYLHTPKIILQRQAAKDSTNAQEFEDREHFETYNMGQPKGTMHFHRDVLAMCDLFPKHVLHMGADDVVCGTPPIAFTFGLGGMLAFPLRYGACAVLLEKYTPESLLLAIGQYGATQCYTAPTMYRQMALLVSEKPYAFNLKSLRHTVSAGEALPDATRQLWKKATGIEMTDGIGGTEVIHIYISSAGQEVRAGSIGKVVPGYQAQIVDEDMKPVPPGVVGRLAVRGPTGCRYLDDPRQKDYVKDGWNLPGDTFVMDADGYFSYQARNDDMIISAGYNIAGPEVEGALMQHPAVAECGVVGAADPERGQVVMAFVVLKTGHTGAPALGKEIQEFVKQIIAPFKYPRRVVFCDSLPRTETGKLQRFKLRQQAPAFNSEK